MVLQVEVCVDATHARVCKEVMKLITDDPNKTCEHERDFDKTLDALIATRATRRSFATASRAPGRCSPSSASTVRTTSRTSPFG